MNKVYGLLSLYNHRLCIVYSEDKFEKPIPIVELTKTQAYSLIKKAYKSNCNATMFNGNFTMCPQIYHEELLYYDNEGYKIKPLINCVSENYHVYIAPEAV